MENIYTVPRFILASKNIRIVNFVIDLLFLQLIKFLVYLVAVLVPFGDGSLLNWFSSFSTAENYIFFSILMFVYYSAFECFTSKTLAKFITKTVVVLEDGSKPELLTIFGRSLLRLVPFEYFTFLRGRSLGMHDNYSNTFVVSEKKLLESKEQFYQS